MRYNNIRLSDNRELTPEGFLLCRNVVCATTTPINHELNGEQIDVVIPAELLERAAQSIIGKPVTIQHHDSINSNNVMQLARGSVIRAEAVDGKLIGDILITDAEAIQYIHDGYQCVSIGADVQYTDGQGVAEVTDININHLALCAQGKDAQAKLAASEVRELSEKTTLKEKIMAIFASDDTEEAQAKASVDDMIRAMGERLVALETKIDAVIEMLSSKTEEVEIEAAQEDKKEVNLEQAVAQADEVTRAQIAASLLQNRTLHRSVEAAEKPYKLPSSAEFAQIIKKKGEK